MTENDVYIVGLNKAGEFGLDHTKPIRSLTKLYRDIFDYDANECIQQIYSGKSYTIYSDNRHQLLFSAGTNEYGSCAIGISSLEPITERQSITYFSQNNIKIRKICVNNCSYCTFWISDEQRIYANGSNICGQLGLGDRKHRNKPTLIPDLNNVINVQSALNYSIALCINVAKHSIIPHWCRNIRQILPADIINLILIFNNDNGSNSVYSTEYSRFGGNGRNNDILNNDNLWKQINLFDTADIIQIKTGCYHSLFLESNGNVWSCGRNDSGQCGIGILGNIRNPVKISYFVNEQIKIIDISSGYGHNLAIDERYNVYSWGLNDKGQCGNGKFKDIKVPKLISFFENKKVCQIQCGYNHSYCKTVDGYYYFFGSNEYRECFKKHTKRVAVPFCINDLIDSKCNKRQIKLISMGYCNTKIIVE